MNSKVNNLLTIISLIISVALVAYLIFNVEVFRHKPKLDDTSLIINSTEGILEYISVEYYGEAIASSTLDSEAHYVEYRDEIKALYDIIRLELRSYEEQGNSRRKKITRLNLFKADNISIRNDPKYHQILGVSKRKNEWNALEFIRKTKWTDFIGRYNNFYSRRELKNKIAYVGRGWVQAGFNFEKISKKDIVINDTLKSITINGVKPEIIDCIINPWLVPNDIKGYEIIFSEGGNIDNVQIQRTKKNCKDSLLNNALIKGEILFKAKKSAEEFFPNFFSVLLNKEIQSVKFNISDNELWLKSVAFDAILNLSEINKIESYYANIETLQQKEDFKNEILPQIMQLEKSDDAKDRAIEIN
jgi:hypothetical protein